MLSALTSTSLSIWKPESFFDGFNTFVLYRQVWSESLQIRHLLIVADTLGAEENTNTS